MILGLPGVAMGTPDVHRKRFTDGTKCPLYPRDLAVRSFVFQNFLHTTAYSPWAALAIMLCVANHATTLPLAVSPSRRRHQATRPTSTPLSKARSLPGRGMRARQRTRRVSHSLPTISPPQPSMALNDALPVLMSAIHIHLSLTLQNLDHNITNPARTNISIPSSPITLPQAFLPHYHVFNAC